MNRDLTPFRAVLDENELLITEIYNEIIRNQHLGNTKALEQLNELRVRLYNFSHLFATEVEPFIQRTLHKCPLSFGLMEKILSPNYLFNSPWTPKINKNINVTGAELTTTTTTTTSTNNASNTTNEQVLPEPMSFSNNNPPDSTTNTTGTTSSLRGKKKKEHSNTNQKQKRIKWTQVDCEAFNKSLEKRGARDLEGIARDTNKTPAQVKAHLNALRLEERRSKPLAPITP